MLPTASKMLFWVSKFLLVMRLASVTAVALCLIITLSDYLYCWKKTRERSWAPCVSGKTLLSGRLHWKRNDYNYDGEFAAAYEKYSKKGKAFLTTDIVGKDYFVVVPPRHCDEWSAASRDHLSWGRLMGEEYCLGDLGLDLTWSVRTLTVQACNRNEFLERLEPFIMSEIDTSLKYALSPAKEWKTYELLDTTFKLSRHVAVLVVLGPGFSKNTELAELLTIFNSELADRMGSHQHYPILWKPIVRHFSNKTRRVKATMAAMKKVIEPEIIRRRAHGHVQAVAGTETVKENKKQKARGPDTAFSYLDVMIGLVMRKYSSGAADPADNPVASRLDMMAGHVVFWLFEVIGAITPVVSTLLLQVTLAPEYAHTLRKELTDALRCSGEDRLFKAYKYTPILESFTKETLRMHTPIKFVGGGYVQKPLHLPSLNRVLLPGTKIVLPGRWSHLDPDNYSKPTVFDGYRFCKGPDGDERRCTIRDTITPTPKWLLFGIGTSACPARFLGLRICQALFSKVLMSYELEAELEHGQLLFLHSEANMFVNPSVKIRVRVLGDS